MTSNTRITIVFHIFLLILTSSFSVQAAGEVDTSFRGFLTTFGTGHVRRSTVQPDGKILIAGQLGLVNGTFRSHLTRLNADGTVDMGFNPPAFAGALDINVMAVQPSGKILIGGNFETATRRYLMRLNPDGSVDPTFVDLFPMGSNSLGTVHDIAFYPDGRIMLAGEFRIQNLPGGAERRYLVRMDANGNVDLSFEFFQNAQVFRFVLLPDGKVVSATFSGSPTMFNTIWRSNSDGSTDASFTANSATNLADMELQPDGKILVAGPSFAPLSRINTDGTTDATYPSFTVTGGVNVITRDATGKYYIGGSFTQISGNTAYKKVARLNADGSLDPTFSYTAHTFPEVRDLDVQADGRLVVSGNGVAPPGIQNPLTRVNSDGSPDVAFHVPINVNIGTGYRVLVQPDNKILVSGQFDAASGYDRARIARYNADGTVDLGFTPPALSGGAIHDMALQPDGKILLTGLGAGVVRRLNSNGTLDTSFDISAQNHWDIEYQSDGKILTGGSNLSRYNSDGSLDVVLATLNPNPLPQIYEIAIQQDGKILIAGDFTQVNGVNRSKIARLNANGTLDMAFDPQASLAVRNISLQSDGKIIIAGDFTGVGGQPRAYLARLNSDGSVDTGFTPGINGPVLATKIQPDGKILIGGAMNVINGVVRTRIARINANGSTDLSFDSGSGVNNTVWSIDQQSDGRIVYAGQFTMTNGHATPGVGRLLNATAPLRRLFDYDGDGKADISVFRPSENKWYIFRSSDSVVSQTVFAIANDIPVPADYDGDNKTDIAIFRPSSGDWWYVSSLDGTQRFVHWGATGDIPRPSDFDGDGKTDFVVFRPSNNFWYRISGATNLSSNIQFGLAGDKPVIGDFDGDGKSDPAIFRPSTGDWWYQSSINNAQLAVRWGISTDIPAPADFDGDGKTDFAVYRPSTGVWYVINSSNGSFLIGPFGISEDKPVPADYDGDGKAELAVFRPSTGIWYQLRTSGGFFAMQFGVSTDTPTPNAFIP